jgi:multidrug resistance protein
VAPHEPLRASRSTAAALATLAAFTDILAYSIAVPVLPDLSRRVGASPTTIGFLFAAFGVTLLATSVPMGAISDRIGRRGPLIAGAIALTASTILFALADTLPWLFLARLVQGAADAVTWVVGMALIADLYDADERGRMMGLFMSGTTVGFMIGPTAGGWLYEMGGPQFPFLAVAALSALCTLGFIWMQPPRQPAGGEPAHFFRLLRVPAVAVCALTVILGGGTLAMLEPTLSLFLAEHIGLGPSRIGQVFGASAVTSALLHPVFGRVADRTGGRRLMLVGLAGMALLLPLLSTIWSFSSAVLLNMLFTVSIATMVTPSLAYMADATSKAGVQSFGVAYGVYNVAWAIGLLVGPSIGGAAYERVGFERLTIVWAVCLLVLTVMVARARADA